MPRSSHLSGAETISGGEALRLGFSPSHGVSDCATGQEEDRHDETVSSVHQANSLNNQKDRFTASPKGCA